MTSQVAVCVLGACLLGSVAAAQPRHELTISGTRFLLDGKPFPYTGVSFFNAVYNPAFNKSSADRREWIEKFRSYGINVFRIWAQWDNKRGFVDACPDCTLYHPDGSLREQNVKRLKDILADADAAGCIVELALFSHESYGENIRLGDAESKKAVASLARELMPYRNLVMQIWNEHTDEHVIPHIKTIKSIDPKRLVTNSPGFAGVLGTLQQNQILDFLSPHTTRSPRHWEIAPAEIEYLLTRFNKPVVDDEPARNGTRNFGGPREGTEPVQHILQIHDVWRRGGYVVYHHDMFQTGYGSPAIPPSGIPDPEFSSYHKQVFEFLALRDKYMKAVGQ